MGIANVINVTGSAGGGEIIRELINSSDGQGLHFNGTSSYVDIASPPDLGTKFSFEFVIKADQWGSNSQYILDFGSSGRFLLYSVADNGYNLAIYQTSAHSFGVKVLDDLKVHHLVVTVDGTAAVLYDNGNQVGTATIEAPTIDSAADAVIGARITSFNYPFNGSLYRTRFYNKTLTQAEVDNAYQKADVDFADQYGSQTSKLLNGTAWTGASGTTAPNSWTTGTQGTYTIDSSSGSGSEPALKIARNSNNPYIYQTFAAIVGVDYRVKYRVKNIDATHVRVGIGSSAVGTQYNVTDYTAASWASFEQTFTATTTTFSVYAQISTSTGTQAGYIDSVLVEQIGAVTDYDLAFANPTQSLQIWDRSSNGITGMASATGVSQTQPIKQFNSRAMRVGTIAASPASGELIAGKLTVGDSSTNEILVGFESSSQDFGIGANGTNFMIGTSATDLDTGNLVTITSAGNVEQHTNSNGIVKYAVKNEDTGTSARAMVNVSSDSANLDIMANSAAYNGVSGWGDSGVISTGSGSSGGLKLNAVAGGLALQTSQTTRMSISSGGDVGIGTGSSAPLAKLNVKGTQGNWYVDPETTTGEIRAWATLPANDGFRTYRLRTYETIFDTNGVERVKIDSAGLATFANGIAFSQTNTSATGATATSATLDHYEEGTFTVTLGGAIPATVANVTGYYTRTGSIVNVCYYSGSFTSDGSAASITGLPFTVNASAYGGFFCYHNTYVPTADTGYFSVNTTTGYFTASNTTASAASANASGRYLMFTGTYKV